MLSKDTVLILGAGAGADIDMCLGSDLMKRIVADCQKAGDGGPITQAITDCAEGDSEALKELMRASRQIAIGVTSSGSIDNYIYHHRNKSYIKAVGKIAIVNAILDYERSSKVFIDFTKAPLRFRDHEGLEKSWLHTFFRLLGEGLVVGETLENIFDRLCVINFNYDRCFEQYVWLALQHRFSIDLNDANHLMERLRIHHPYGKVAATNWQSRAGLAVGGDPHKKRVDLCALSQNIRTYNEEIENGEDLARAHNWVSSAERIVFLGFHFYDQNVALLKPGIPLAGESQLQQMFATVIGRSAPEQHIITQQINSLSRAANIRLASASCANFFSAYGTTFTH